MTAAWRWTGLGKLLSFYRYFAFDGPRVTTGLGVTALLGVGAIRLYLLVVGGPALPTYLAAYFALLIAGVLASAAAMLGRGRRLPGVGWAVGGFLATVSVAMYVASRTPGLPELSHLVGRWDYPLGTFAMALAALFLALHFSVVTGMNVAYPNRRQWHD